ncbi:MAG TPA: hypothetical protein VE398_02250 [Acidobacteriota bacterium]|nr:hypothetical protein [Acidobacteriota bacterium]
MVRLPFGSRFLSCFLLAAFLGAATGSVAQGKQKNTEKKVQPVAAVSSSTQAASPDFAAALENLSWRSIGPAVMGGRIDDFAVVESKPSIVYVGTASGGIFKTTNAGTTWEPIFDNEAVSTIGDLALAPSDPSILWVGTGESNNRQSSDWGNGIYKSVDAGKTWAHMGLKDTHHIGRVVVHPRNPGIVYVAAAGHLWGPNKERGVYKTVDGGKSWSSVLFIDEDTGVNDLVIDPESPDTLYAGAFQRRRTVFGYNGGGPGSAIYKTTDGGITWRKLTKGMPYEQGGDTGRIGLAIYRKNPSIVYALVEHAKGGIFRSEDKGETWTKMSDTNPRPSYYSQVLIDPNNDLRIWVMGAPLYHSEDGGKTFVTSRGQRIHSDFHAGWIDPGDSNHMIFGTDGGIHQTYDAGRTWDFINTIPLGQFYEIGADMQKPYHVCGGLQDNNTWCGPSATTASRGIANDDWMPVGGGDGFYAQIDPTDPDVVYAESQDGNVLRRDMRTGQSKSIRPMEKEGEARYRFQWNSPIVVSSHDPRTVYYGGNFLFKSTDRGDNWMKASPDLTTGADRSKMPIMGKAADKDTLSRNDGVQQWPCITTISESVLNAQVLWVGTDDGNLQVTRDGGATWKNVVEKIPGVPRGIYVGRIVASRHAEGTAYVNFDGHRSNEFGIYVFATTDYGETWKNIGGGLPQNNGVVRVVREDVRNPDLLFLGTEYGVYASWDSGTNWTRLKMNLPTARIDDILVHPRDNDLIIGTHGRSIWIMDDITPLQQLGEKILASDLFLFDVRPPIAWRMWNRSWFSGNKEFIAPNPPYGAIINFYLKNKLDEKERVRISILDKSGKSVRDLTCGEPAPAVSAPSGEVGALAAMRGFGATTRCDAKPGINRAAWDLRQSLPRQAAQESEQQTGRFGMGRGPLVDPGEYTVRIAVTTAGAGPGAARDGEEGAPGKWETSKVIRVEEDPRVTLSDSDRTARRQALNQVMQLSAGSSQAQRSITALRTNLNNAIEGWKRPGGPRIPEEIRTAADALLKKVDEIFPQFGTLPSEAQPLGNAGPPLIERPSPLPQRIGRVMSDLDGYSAAPTATQLEQIKTLSELVKNAGEQVRRLVSEDLANLNKMMRDADIPYVSATPSEGGAARRRQ